jgi:hypothetical protein
MDLLFGAIDAIDSVGVNEEVDLVTPELVIAKFALTAFLQSRKIMHPLQRYTPLREERIAESGEFFHPGTEHVIKDLI